MFVLYIVNTFAKCSKAVDHLQGNRHKNCELRLRASIILEWSFRCLNGAITVDSQQSSSYFSTPRTIETCSIFLTNTPLARPLAAVT